MKIYITMSALNQSVSVHISGDTHDCIVEFACFTLQLFCQTKKNRKSIIASVAAMIEKRGK